MMKIRFNKLAATTALALAAALASAPAAATVAAGSVCVWVGGVVVCVNW